MPKRPRDRRGAMPFALVAVLVLVLSSLAVVVMFSYEDESRLHNLTQASLEEMRDLGGAEAEEIRKLAYSAGIEAIRAQRDLDEDGLKALFIQAFNASLEERYPNHSGRYSLVVISSNVSISFLKAALYDAYVSYNGEAPETSATSGPAYFAVSGLVMLNISSDRGFIKWGCDMGQEIYVPLPLLLDRLERLQASAAPYGDLQSMVSYMLSALAQDRVLAGYGMTASKGLKSTEAILTQQDVLNAVNTAVVLEQLRILRASGDGLDAQGAISSAIAASLEDVDPADLFLRAYGETTFDLGVIAEQAILAVLDRVLFATLEYMGIDGLINLGEDVLEALIGGARDVWDMITGGNWKEDEVKDRVREAMNGQGLGSHLTLPGFDGYFSDEAIVVVLTSADGTGHNVTLAGGQQFSVSGMDPLASSKWADFYSDYISSTYAVYQKAKSAAQSAAAALASKSVLGTATIRLDPSDGYGFLDDVEEMLSRAFLENRDWLQGFRENVVELAGTQDDLCIAALGFLEDNWRDLYDVEARIDSAARLASASMAASAVMPNGTDEAYMRAALESWLYDEMTSGALRDQIEAAIKEKVRSDSLYWYDLGLTAVQGRSSGGEMMDKILSGAADLTASIPGIETLFEMLMQRMIDDMEQAAKLYGRTITVPGAGEGFTLISRDGAQRLEEIVVDSRAFVLSGDGPRLTVSIINPDDPGLDRNSDTYPNHHFTELTSTSLSSYMTQWTVSYSGLLPVTVSIAGGGFDGAVLADVPVTADIQLNATFNVVACSAWGLKGVQYAPTSTLFEAFAGALQAAWRIIASGATALAQMAWKVISALGQLASGLISMEIEVIQKLCVGFMECVSSLNGIIQDGMGELAGIMADLAQTILGGTTINLTLLGIHIKLDIAERTSTLNGAREVVSLLVESATAGAFSATMRILRKEDGSHIMLGELSAKSGGNEVHAALDPQGVVYDHFVEASATLLGMRIDLKLPEIAHEQTIEARLSNVPGVAELLRSIPLPVPGLKAELDASVAVIISLTSQGAVIINEVEANPAGADSGNERIELYNPTAQAVDLTGWTLVTAHGKVRTETLGAVTIPSGGYYVHTFSAQALDNSGSAMPYGESVVLYDASGRKVDSAAWHEDTSNDARTWQRERDGSEQWVFREGTLGSTNGAALTEPIEGDEIVDRIAAAFLSAVTRLAGQPLDSRTLQSLFQMALSEVRSTALASVERYVSSAQVVLDVGAQDATGSAHVRMSLIMSVDGDGLEALGSFVSQAVGRLVSDPLNPQAAAERAGPLADELLDHVKVSVRSSLLVSSPSITKAFGLGTSAETSGYAEIGVNIRAVTSGLWNAGRLDFGIALRASVTLPLIPAIGLTGGDSVTMWLIRGSIAKA